MAAAPELPPLPPSGLTHNSSGNLGSIKDSFQLNGAIHLSKSGLDNESSSVSGYLPGGLLDTEEVVVLEEVVVVDDELELEVVTYLCLFFK